ncbi:MAG: ATP-binding protein [Arcicella sp.]|nr:ATP-binding protein [Arcicella sp.]
MKNYIKRPIYMDKIMPFLGKNIIKVLTGQRRVGKSYLMYQIIEQLKATNSDINIIYIDKEKYEFDSIKNYEDLINYYQNHSIEGKNALFIDEVQDINEFEKALRSLYSRENIDIYITGSNANMLSGELATFLSGRYIEIQVNSLSYPEFLIFHQKSNSQETFMEFLRFGGLPNLIHFPLEEPIVSEYLQNIYHTILYKDVIRRNSIRNVSFLENLVNYLADNLGSIVSAKKISDFLKSQQVSITPNTVLDYLDFIQNSFFIHRAKRQEIKGKKIFEIGEKFYFEDTGLRNSIVGFRLNEIQKLLENVVYNHLRICGYKVRVGVLGQNEIDFVAEKNNETVYVQVCYLIQEQATHDREFGNLLAIKNQFPKYVLSMDALHNSNTFMGINHKSIPDFLIEFS